MNSQSPGNIDFLFNLFEKARVNICLLIDSEGIILKVSSLFTYNFGYTNDDLLGKHFSILFTEEDRKLYMPLKELKKVMHDGWASDCNYLNCKSGARIWVSGESLLVNDNENYIIKIFQNIHEHKLTQYEAILEKDFNENILTSIEDSILVLDRDRRIVKYNTAFISIWGNRESFQFDRFLSRITFPRERNELERKVQDVFDKGLSFRNYIIELFSRDTENLVFEVNGQPLLDKTAGQTVLLAMHDVTSYKKLEKDQEDMLGFVAHELRNPLTNLVLCNKLIQVSLDDNDVVTAKETLIKSKKNIDRLSQMVAELYNATQIHGGQMLLAISDFAVEEMIHEAIEIVMHDHPSFYIHVNGKTGVRMSGDKFKLIQVLTNFLSNAIKYSDGKPDISINVTDENNSLTISVADHGVGISMQYLPYIFDRFFRVEKTRNLEGIGLGLYLCRRIIHAHYGHIWAESEESGGSIFYFSIPLKYPES